MGRQILQRRAVLLNILGLTGFAVCNTTHQALANTNGQAGFPRVAQAPLHLRPEPLTLEEIGHARAAWAYFVVNENPQTGLVPTTSKFPSMTLWDQGGYLLAIVSAQRLGLVSRFDTVRRLKLVLQSLSQLPLYGGYLPNKAYNITTLQMTDYSNAVVPKGIGYSALDIMRLLSGIMVAAQHFPEVRDQARATVARWDVDQLAADGRLQGIAVRRRTNMRRVQEGRIGYEQYAARVGALLGLPLQKAVPYDPILRWQRYYSISLPGDRRTARTHGVSSVTTSEPFLLEALEYGWRPDAFAVASAVFDAQHFRFIRTGQSTALSEDHIQGAPYFAYDSILTDNRPFASVTARRADAGGRRRISTKASFGWWALMRHSYTLEQLAAVRDLRTDQGWYAGRFEADNAPNKILTLNTNAVILEALHYKALGPLYR